MNAPRIMAVALTTLAGHAAGSANQVVVAEYNETFSVSGLPGDLSMNIFSAVAVTGLPDPFESQYLFGVESIGNGAAGMSFFYDLTQPAYAPHVARLTNGVSDELWLGADTQAWGDYRTRSEASLFTGAPAPGGGVLAGPDLAGFTPTTVEMMVDSISLNDNGFEVTGNASVIVRYFAEAPIADPFDVSGVEFWDLRDDSDNTVLTFDLAAAAGLPSGTPVSLLSYAHDLVLTTIDPSWLSEASMSFDFLGDGSEQLLVTPGGGIETPAIAEPLMLGPISLGGFVSPDGLVRIQFFDTFDDYPDAVDAFFEAGSRLIFELEPGPMPCNQADLALDFGVLDLADLSAFVSAFVTGDLDADLSGDGIFDLQDVTAFVTAFTTGCP